MTISFDRDVVDRPRLHAWLAGAYWAQHRSAQAVDESLENSLCVSAWVEGEMVGFGRAVTDYATFAWLCDVIVAPERRGQGVGTAIVEAILAHPRLQTVRWMLGTRDAHTLYERYGFVTSNEPDRWMTKNFNVRPPRDELR